MGSGVAGTRRLHKRSRSGPKDVIMKIFKYLLAAAGLLALASSSALAYEPGTFILRGGVGTISPQSKALSGEVEDAAFYEACVEVDDGTGFLWGGTYMVTRKFGIDLLGAMPISHDVDVELWGLDVGSSGDSVDSIDETAVSGRFAKVKQLPPTVTFQWHMAPDRKFQPYVGVGMNFTTFTSAKYQPSINGLTREEIDAILGIEKIHLKDSFGVAAQLGGDWMIGDHTVVSLDVRYMDIDSELFISGDSFDGREKVGTLDIDPWIYSLNLGYQF